MMKRLISLFTLLSLVLASPARAEDPIVDDDIFYTEEDEELFNRGRFVGLESDDYLRRERRARNTNWAIALGTTALGIATVILVGNSHNR